jgi:hypothetical protein
LFLTTSVTQGLGSRLKSHPAIGAIRSLFARYILQKFGGGHCSGVAWRMGACGAFINISTKSMPLTDDKILRLPNAQRSSLPHSLGGVIRQNMNPFQIKPV